MPERNERAVARQKITLVVDFTGTGRRDFTLAVRKVNRLIRFVHRRYVHRLEPEKLDITKTGLYGRVEEAEPIDRVWNVIC